MYIIYRIYCVDLNGPGMTFDLRHRCRRLIYDIGMTFDLRHRYMTDGCIIIRFYSQCARMSDSKLISRAALISIDQQQTAAKVC